MTSKYAIGYDFGTESVRALLVRLPDGQETATAVSNYAHGVMDRQLPDGKPLGPDWALQHPSDYLESMTAVTREVLAESGVEASQIIGIGLDFTACTMLPTDENGEPLCLDDAFRSEPNAWVKLWKHHAAQPEADKINEVARERNESFLARYGGKVSSEWMLPKIWQTLNEAPEIYEAAARFIEAGDWVVWRLTGREVRNACAAGYKAMWDSKEGYPSDDFLRALDPRLAGLNEQKLSAPVVPPGSYVGDLTEQAAAMLGLPPGIAVAAAGIDAHTAVPASTVCTPGKMVIVMGTSFCHMLLSEKREIIPGLCGVVENGILEGYYGYEAGQVGGGDIYAWLMKNIVPAEYEKAAEKKGLDIYAYMESLAAAIKPGRTGLLALDWWNGNRSVLVDADLTGVLVGCTLGTRVEEIYRALMEATAFGTRVIIEAFTDHGVAVDEIIVCGGLPERNTLLMQIFADVTGRELRVAASQQTAALGAAMFAAVAAGEEKGGFGSIVDAARAMAKVKDDVYRPNAEAHAIYDDLYKEYLKLHDYFGRGVNNVMKKLKALRAGE